MCVDYSQTINKFTYLDAYPLPRIEDQINKLSKYHFFSTLDLTSAYHQIPLLTEDKPYTAFEADGKLFQFTRLPFGLTNAVVVFQRKTDELIIENSLKNTYAYLDNITIAGITQAEHDSNLKKFYEAATCHLCHPGITRMNHFVCSRNLPYSIEDIKSVINHCITCCELKPRFYEPPSTHLIKATQPFEHLNIDFKGPLPTSTKNRYIFTIIDE